MTILVVGANRGIGLELCRQLAARSADRGGEVIAACRAPGGELKRLGVRVVGGVDVGDDAGVDKLTEALDGVRLRMLIHNAGILTTETFADLNFARMMQQYQINALGPLRVARAVINAGALAGGGKIGIVSSRVGSLADNTSGGIYGYRMSKAAVNMAGVNLAHDLREKKIAVRLLHPGLVATDMTGGRGIQPADAARGLIAQMDELTLENTGEFWHAEGFELPW